jgi:transcriptional regulator GlxA family with amidase domain
MNHRPAGTTPLTVTMFLYPGVRQLALRFPGVQVEPDAIFVQDGRMTTSAGASAGIDLSSALVEEHYGPEVAEEMVVFMQRPGGQSQFSVSGGMGVPSAPVG